MFHPALLLGSTALFVLTMVLYDRRVLGRLHPVTLWAGLTLIVSFPIRLALAHTALWQAIATRLID